jgi:hypothetical protein
MVQDLAAKVAFDRIGRMFGDRGDQLVRDALRIKEICSNTTERSERSATVTQRPRTYDPTNHSSTSSTSSTSSSTAIHFYVSPTGSDSNDGSAANPFLSPTRARDAIRAARSNRVTAPSTAQAVVTAAVVTVLGGHYFLGTLGALQLTAEDSYTSWIGRAQINGPPAPFFSGAIELKNLSWASVGSGSKILAASLPPDPPSTSARFATLFDGHTGKRLVRARTGAGNGGFSLDPETTSGLCFKNGHGALEGCDGYIDSAGSVNSFKGTVVKHVQFNTSRGGRVKGDDVYKTYDVIFEVGAPSCMLLPCMLLLVSIHRTALTSPTSHERRRLLISRKMASPVQSATRGREAENYTIGLRT